MLQYVKHKQLECWVKLKPQGPGAGLPLGLSHILDTNLKYRDDVDLRPVGDSDFRILPETEYLVGKKAPWIPRHPISSGIRPTFTYITGDPLLNFQVHLIFNGRHR